MSDILKYLVFCLLLPASLMGQVREKDSLVSKAHSLYDQIDDVYLYWEKPVALPAIVAPQIMQDSILERLNTYSVADAVRYFSGAQIKDYGGVGGLKTIDIRGMGSQHVGVFYGGIQVTNAQNGIVDLGKFSTEDIASIELYNGQKSSILQAARDYGTAGQIYISPKKPSLKNGESTNLKVKYRLGSIKTHNPSLRWEQKLSPKLSMALSSEYIYSDGIYKFRYRKKNNAGQALYDTTAHRHNSELHAGRIEWSLYHDVHNGENWNIRAYSYLSKRGIPGAIVNNNFGEASQKLEDRNLFVQGHYFKSFSPKFKLQLKGKFAYDYNRYIDTLAPQRPKIDNNYIQREAYLSASSVYHLTDELAFNLAVDFQENNMSSNLYNFSKPRRTSTLSALSATYDIGKFKAQASLLGTFVQNRTKRNKAPDNENRLTPAFFASYSPLQNKDLELHAFYKEIFRLPTFNEMYYKVLGMSLLNPEFTQQYDVGLTYTKTYNNRLLQHFQFKIDGYYNTVNDKIVSAFNGNMFTWMNLGLGKVKIKGFDAQIQTETQIGDFKLRPLFAYSFMQAQDFTDRKKTYYGHLIPYSPKQSMSFSLLADYKDWGLNYSLIYTGSRYDANQDNIDYNYLPPWRTHDLSLQKKFDFNGIGIYAVAEINNLWNEYYDVILNYPMPGRNYRFTLKFEL